MTHYLLQARDSARLLDSSKLQLTIPANQNAIIRDRSGHLIAIVLRNFCEDEEVLAWVNEVIAADVKIKRSVRVSRAAVTAFEEVDIRCRKKILGR